MTKQAVNYENTYLEKEANDAFDKPEKTNFKPEPPYTQDFFNKVRNSTFQIHIGSTNESTAGTCWCAYRDKEYVYFVTNKHVVSKGGNKNNELMDVQLMQVLRPNIDQDTYWFEKDAITIIPSEKDDIAIIRCKIKPEDLQIFAPLRYKDKIKKVIIKKALTVGFPDSFDLPNTDDLHDPTFGQIVNIEKYDESIIQMSGFSHPGVSGSPFVIADEDGYPTVVGIITGSNDRAELANWKVVNNPIIFASTLSIDSLIEKAKLLK